ncbi:hypothetical protein CDL15_Pgr011331 [Punica granatum]|uniref:Uncharacterized protein n=1 Tax=Punica granatum TaxID=22663 RepID=A0A218WEC3_PUNGR|nr:hypothetical protein CDL15_Pgr011331 [Punica granatum]PKI65051.1 hypothetical protein CRG98_014520 [Punica granatum]
MAAPTNLVQIAREGFAMIDEFFGRQQRTPLPPPPREPKSYPCHRQKHPCVYHYTESPLITERLPYAQALPNGTVVQHQYTYQPSPTIGSVHEVSQYQGSGGQVQ